MELLITLVTLNVYQGFTEPAARYAAIGAELEVLAPDIATFQEVAVRGGKSSVDGVLPGHVHRVVRGTPGGYQQAILSRWPIVRVVEVPFRNNRRRMGLGAVIEVPGFQKPWLVLTTHLDFQLEHHKQRAAQLEELLAAAATHDGPVVLTGDLNFGDGESEESVLRAPGWVDVFRDLHPKLPGFTWDRERNPMAKAGSLAGEPSRRLDRVVVRGLRGRTARVVMNTAIKPRLFPSDHFGVLATLTGQ